MCGIHAVIGVRDSAHPAITGTLKQSLQKRGPDHLGHVSRTVLLDSDGADNSTPLALHLSFTSTVLALRGDHVARQPLHDPREADGSVLCWNGEAWRFDGQPVPGNDGEALLSRLSQRGSEDISSSASASRQEHVLGVFRSIQGPFAVVYYDALDRRVYYGRDRLGRRSLLLRDAGDGDSRCAVALSSIAGQPATDWTEVPANGLYSLNLDAFKDAAVKYDQIVERHPWLDTESDVSMVSNVGHFNAATEKSNEACSNTQTPEAPHVDDLAGQLMSSLDLRVVNVPRPPHGSHLPNEDASQDVRVAILFSGGLDCTVLARLAHELVPAAQGLDLINVAFENPRLVAQYLKQPEELRTTDFYETCPDRITARKAFAELRRACPGRTWRLIAVNVPFTEAMDHKSTVISLIYPHDTEMDLSIAIALYFAARATGHAYMETHEWSAPPPPSSSDSGVVTSPARVLISGLGADELFGGYARHEVAFKRAGYPGLAEELRLDVDRIGQRNLGRDDRVMSHWGKEVRFPFLDEEVVRFAVGLPVWAKCDFGWQQQRRPDEEEEVGGQGTDDIEPAKRILRLLADRKGLPLAAREKKRAIQFGSRTAKMESATGRVKGTASIAPSSSPFTPPPPSKSS